MTSSSKTALALAALLAAASAHSGTSGTTSVIEGVQNFSDIDFNRVNCAGCVDQKANTDSSPLGTSTITAYAMSDYGVLKTAVSATGLGDGALGRVDASATFDDHFEIDAAGLTGQQGYFKARVTMPFTASVSAEPYTVGSLTAFVRVNDKESWAEHYGSSNGTTISYVDHDGVELAIGTPMIFDVPFVYGQPIAIFGFMDLAIEGQTSLAYPSFAVTIDASHSLYWQGISEVTDGRGNAVAGYTLTSDSGTDWSRDFSPSAVPEPANIALLLAGFGLLALRRRAR
ncbi:MAG: PEP-CTERM sorting domain-containing protein [Pseudomonadota bacterium]|nr:PEP-CTERM sorting domain-containing protein [Pseudomonadota bacterium]